MGNHRPAHVQTGSMKLFPNSLPVSPNRLLALFVVFAGLVAAASSQDLARIADNISHGSTEQKRNALAELRGLRSPEASLIAIAGLRDHDELVRATAINAVVFLPEPEAAAVLVPLLSDKAEFIRREAAYALGE